MEKMRIHNPVYPVLAIAASLGILCGGLLLAGRPAFPAIIPGLCILFCIFGFARPLVRVLSVFLLIGLIMGALTLALSASPGQAARTTGRFVVLGLSALPVITMPPVHLTRCMTALKCPRILTLGVLIAVRFFPVLAGECGQIRQAMRTRGANVAWCRPGCLYRAFLIPLLSRIINISDTLSLSLETRAFVVREQGGTVYRPVRFTLRDGLFAAALAALFIGAVALG